MTEEKLVEIPSGHSLAVKIHGNLDDPVVIFCNGSIFTYVQFEHVFVPKLLKKFNGRRYCVILYDYVGYGNSTDLEGDFDFVEIADQHIELMDTLGIKETHLFGYSKGSVIAQIVAAKVPERVLSIAGYGNPNLANPESNSMAKEDFGIRRSRVQELSDIYNEPITEENVSRVYDTVYIPHIFDKNASELNIFDKLLNLWVKRKLVPMMFNTKVNIMDKLFKYYMRDITEEEKDRYVEAIKSLSCPVLLMHGTEDSTVPISSSRMLSEWIPDVKLIELEGYRHSQPILVPWEGSKIMNLYFEFLLERFESS